MLEGDSLRVDIQGSFHLSPPEPVEQRWGLVKRWNLPK